MRRGTIVLSCAWILWITGSSQWVPMQSYPTMEACRADADQHTAMLKSATEAQGHRGLPLATWVCFPSELDPRAPKR